MNYWLVKSEPYKFSWEKFTQEKVAVWDGVRNYAARNNLRAMKKGDLAFFYHSNEGLEIVGIAKIKKEHYQDPTTEDKNWLAVDLVPFKALKKSITLAQIKADKKLQEMQLLKLSRLSVQGVKKEEFDYILELSQTK